MKIDIWFDPACPWCWITSRWVVDVAAHRDLQITWHTFSLLEKNRDHLDEASLRKMQPAHNALRIAEAIAAEHGNEAVGRFYTAIGTRIHPGHTKAGDIDLNAVLEDADLPASLLAAAEDPAWDDAIRASMDAGLARAGQDVGVPLIGFEGGKAYYGPVMTPQPTGDQALALWDALATVGMLDGFFELKNSERPKADVSVPA